MLVSLAVLIGSMQLNMARRAQDHPGSEADVFPFWPFWSRCFSEGTARDHRAGMRAEAYRSMADERGQVWQLQAAVWQVLVDRESRRRARIRRAIAARPGRRGGQFSGSLGPAFQ